MELGISATVALLAKKQCDLAGLDTARLAHGLALPGVTNPMRFGDWNDLAEFFSRAEECLGCGGGLADMCESVAVASLPEGRALMALSPDVGTGIQLINCLCDATFGPALRYPAFRQLGSHRFHVRLKRPQSRSKHAALGYFRSMEGAFRTCAKFAGSTESASVKVCVRPQHADFEIELPRLAPSSDGPRELATKIAFARHWERALRASRRDLLELRALELRARESELFETLSTTLSRALLRAEQRLLPSIAAQAIREVFGCQRVIISRSGQGGKEVLGVAGPAVRGLSVVELGIGDSLLQVAADVARESAEARALASLLPWLGLVCVKMSPPSAPEGAAGPWLDVRLQQLASQWCLTARQEQVALLMVLGESNKHIAAKLQVSEGTVELHAHAVLSKAQLPNRTALAAHFFNAK